MVLHPSLSAPPLKAELITPVETMGRNELCWCRSGLKYKKCHLNRELQKPVNIFEIENRNISQFRNGYCSHPDPERDPCVLPIIKSHTIQKKGGIAAIAEAGHVLTVKPTMKGMIESEGNFAPRNIGINNASVFPGFCSKHDAQLFKTIEGRSLTINKDTAFLFSYRAISYERFAKEAEFKSVAVQREMDKGRSFFHQKLIQTYINTYAMGLQVGRRDVDRWKRQFDERLLSDVRDDFHFMAVIFDRILPIVAASAFHPEFDIQSNPLQRLGRDSIDLDHITVNVTAFENRTIVVFGWIGINDGAAKAFTDAFANAAEERKASILIRILFLHTDNLFLQPSWWKSLPAARQTFLNKMIKSGTPMQMRLGGDFADDGYTLFAAGVVETIRD